MKRVKPFADQLICRVRDYMLTHNLSQAAMARLADMPQSRLSVILNHGRHLSHKNIDKLARVIGLDMEAKR